MTTASHAPAVTYVVAVLGHAAGWVPTAISVAGGVLVAVYYSLSIWESETVKGWRGVYTPTHRHEDYDDG